MEPEVVLELIRFAPERYESVRAALRYRGDGPTIKALRERFLRSEADQREHENPIGVREVDHSEPDSSFGWRCRVWRIDERRWRRELDLPSGGVHITASAGPARWPPGTGRVWNRRVGENPRADHPSWLAQATDHYWTFYPLDPAGISSIDIWLSELDLAVEEERVPWARREAVRLVGVPVEEWESPPEPLWWGPTNTRCS